MARNTPSSTSWTISLCRSLIAVTLAFAASAAWAGSGPKPAKAGDPAVSISLESLGFLTVPQAQLLGGATMYTVHFVDSTHILLTFNSHGLIPRLNDGTSQADDRLITGLLVALPRGEVLARTTWHARDREQYLWPLSHGLFLLRIRSRLMVIDPVRNLARGDAFREQTFLEMKQQIGYISVSPGGDLVTVETIVPPHPESATASSDGTPQAMRFSTEPTAEIRFYRMLFSPPDSDQPPLRAQAAGVVAARTLIRVAATSEGFLDILKESAGTWLFDFQSHAGKRLQLAPFDTTCSPSPYFVSRTEFVAIGCRGSENHLLFSGFNFRGEQPWIQVLSGQQIAPMLVTAPDAGRFAFSRILVSGTYYDVQNLVPEELSGQDIQVIQHHDGRILLHVQASPIQRTGQNFDLSDDGLNFAVIRNGNLEVYRLPGLTAKDSAEVKKAAADMVERSDVRIGLTSKRPEAAQKVPQAVPEVVPAMAVDAPSTTAQKANAGDAQDDGPRKPPSLYGPDYPKSPKE